MVWRLGFLLFCISTWVLIPPTDCVTDGTDVSVLNNLFTSLNFPSQLTGWTSNGGDPCQPWKGITCSGSRVSEIKLPGLGLTGSFGYELDKLTSLTNFDVSNNNIGVGIQLPYQLPPNLQRLDISRNGFGGNLPYSISQMTSLTYLNLAQNQIQGSLSDMFSGLVKLSTLDLSDNTFTGNLPDSFSKLASLTELFLQNNQFTGSINVLANLPLENVNIKNNRFNGWIPDKLKKNKNFLSDGNPWNTGLAPPPPPSSTPPSPKPKPNHEPPTNEPNSGDGGRSKSSIGAGAIAGIVISVLVVASILIFFLIKRKRKKSTVMEKPEPTGHFAPLASSNETNEYTSIQIPNEMVTVETPLPIDMKPIPLVRINSFDGKDNGDKLNTPIVVTGKPAPINATVYSVGDLQMATGSFSIENLVGEGYIGRVYRAQFDDGKVLAVKKINSSSLPTQATKTFMETVSNVARLHHPNVTELVGYCSEHGQHLLVYEFHKNGSLYDLLHLADEYSKPLTWNTRVMIVLGTARALEYLHENCSPSIIHKNIKSANILLDMELNPHLSDCGLSSIVPNAEYQVFNLDLGSGYAAPEVSMSGQYNLKSDVYSFGIIMLELLTGRKPFDSTRQRPEQSLVRWATPQLHDIDALDRMVDSSMKGLYPAKSLSRFVDVIVLCVQSEPEFRPPMSEVVQALVRLVQQANMNKRMGTINKTGDAGGIDGADVHDMF
ncbi:Protein STRUBBELIG-RECEPTOR FAMILY 7 [Zostera marina]|uniref:Protein STRUBBELIG-RECEPTOR FAMILY 7 n=1 Tax=Zostera marina TaxID=29655 RepID=A0A0K9NNS9_ZOSMR|nr:Protein STRUBBELIG-RECEPTOR FAMILY 7 [Zostera marina]